MDARPLLVRLAKLLEQHGLEAILIGNAAAALQGAPVTTVDLDFMFRKTPVNLRKLKALADSLEAYVLRPYYPVSDLFRIVNDDDGLQLDFMATIHGVRSFASLRSRAVRFDFDRAALLVASLSDIINSKKAAGRPRDLAVLPLIERIRHEKESDSPAKAGKSQEGE